MTQDKVKEKIGIIFFIMALWMLMIRQMAAMMPILPRFSDIAYIYGDKVLWFGIFLLGIVIVGNKPLVLEIIMCLWSVVSFQISSNSALMILVFLLIAANRINIDKCDIVNAWMIPVTIAMVLVLILYPILHAQGHPVAEDYCGTRWNYFFGHPNGFGLWFTFWILGILYLGQKKMTCWVMSLVLFVAAIFLAIVPGNKTASIVLLLGIPFFILEKYCWKLWKVMIYMIPAGCILMTVVLTQLYYQGILLCNQYVLHPTMSMRFQDAAISLSECPLNLWGQRVYHLGESITFYGVTRSDVSLDNGIIAILIYYGVVLGMFLLAFFVESIYIQAGSEDNSCRIQVILLVLTFIMGMMEWPAWYGTIGFPMFFVGDWIKNNDKKKSKIT